MKYGGRLTSANAFIVSWAETGAAISVILVVKENLERLGALLLDVFIYTSEHETPRLGAQAR